MSSATTTIVNENILDGSTATNETTSLHPDTNSSILPIKTNYNSNSNNNVDSSLYTSTTPVTNTNANTTLSSSNNTSTTTTTTTTSTNNTSTSNTVIYDDEHLPELTTKEMARKALIIAKKKAIEEGRPFDEVYYIYIID
jgi:hypothetical protein